VVKPSLHGELYIHAIKEAVVGIDKQNLMTILNASYTNCDGCSRLLGSVKDQQFNINF